MKLELKLDGFGSVYLEQAEDFDPVKMMEVAGEMLRRHGARHHEAGIGFQSPAQVEIAETVYTNPGDAY
jgi:hypothetical protein